MTMIRIGLSILFLFVTELTTVFAHQVDVCRDLASVMAHERYDLALENGDHELDAIRVHQSNGPAAEFRWILEDFIPILERDPKVEILVATSVLERHKVERDLYPIHNRVTADVRDRISVIVGDDAMGMWPQDDSKPLSVKRRVLAPKTNFLRQNYNFKAALEALIYSSRVDVHTSDLEFDGGDLVVGNRHLFLGEEAVIRNQKVFQESRESILSAYQRIFGKPSIVLESFERRKTGLRASVLFHLDLMMMVVRNRKTDEEVILLSSPRAAFESVPHRETGSIESTRPSRASEMGSILSRSEAFHREWIQWIDQIKSQLGDAGYRVVEVPGSVIDRNIYRVFSNERIFAEYYNYTNSIVSGPYAMVPEMGIKEWDEQARSIFETLGYDVISMPSAFDYFRRRGGPRCASSLMRRETCSRGHR